MVRAESLWIKQVLEKIFLPKGAQVLDVGSSTYKFRTEVQPYIDSNVFVPLRERGVKVWHLDKKPDRGVDIVCDLHDISRGKLGKTFDLVLCCSLLEHINNPVEICQRLKNILNPSGFLLVSVPFVYRYHPDPIDTMFRPNIKKLMEIINQDERMKVITAASIRVKDRNRYKNSIRESLRYYLPFLNWRISCLLLRKK